MSLAFGAGYESNIGAFYFGENLVREMRHGCCYAQHAEMDVMRKLPSLNSKKNRIKKKVMKQAVNLMVIRIDRNGMLKNSTPCHMCIKYMERFNNLTSYKIDNVYYSNENGNVALVKFNALLESPIKYVTSGFKSNK